MEEKTTTFGLAESRYLRMLGDPDRYTEDEKFEIERAFSTSAAILILNSL